jgi:hypothetical protein
MSLLAIRIALVFGVTRHLIHCQIWFSKVKANAILKSGSVGLLGLSSLYRVHGLAGRDVT